MQCGEVMRCQWLCTGTSSDTWMTLALTIDLIALTVPRAAHITAAVLAAKQGGTIQVEGAIFALITATSCGVWLAVTIARLGGTCIQSGNSTINITIAFLATLGIGDSQIPVEWLALVTNASRNALLTFA